MALGFGEKTLDWDDGDNAGSASLGESKDSLCGEAPASPRAGEQPVAARDAEDAGPASTPGSDAPAGSQADLPAAPTTATRRQGAVSPEEARALFSKEIPRFRRSERAVHWSVAIPFLVCLATGITVKLFFNQLHPQSLTHAALLWTHRISGICLLLLPTWVARRHRHDLSLYLYNIKRAWTWTRDDVKWLALAGPAALNPRIALPEQHKFNAGEKLNFMALTLSYPVLVATGLAILMPGMYFVTWIVHVSVAVLAAPLIFGHIFMAVINPETRIGLSGMFSGNVDREWAKHHYALWYREHFGEEEARALAALTSQDAALDEALESPPAGPGLEPSHSAQSLTGPR